MTISVIDGFPSPYFQSKGVFRSKMGLWKQNIDGSCFLIHSDQREVVSQCGFDLYFPDEERCKTQQFQMLDGSAIYNGGSLWGLNEITR